MKVYLIHPRWEGPAFKAAFTTEEGAKKFIKRYAEWHKEQKRTVKEHSPDPSYLDIIFKYSLYKKVC